MLLLFIIIIVVITVVIVIICFSSFFKMFLDVFIIFTADVFVLSSIIEVAASLYIKTMLKVEYIPGLESIVDICCSAYRK